MTIPTITEVLSLYTEFTGLHPIAEIFPMKSEEEFGDLVRHIEANGVVEKILREKGTGLLVDGRNRLLACSITHSLFEIEDIDSEFILMTVTAKNLHAKQFTASQRSTIANDLRPFYDEKAKARQVLSGGDARMKTVLEKIPEPKDAPTARDEAGKVAGVNAKYVDMARDVSLVDTTLYAEVKNGTTTITDAHKRVKAQAAAMKHQQKPTPVLAEQVPIVTAKGVVTMINKPKMPVFNETNESVSWAKWTWNPVTGCEHGCKFCYARAIANSARMAEIYPNQFEPTFHEYRLTCPENTVLKHSDDPKDRRVFVCSMADLFGKWVPDAWIEAVFQAAIKNPKFEYLFLTKWPKRYSMLKDLPEAWLGASVIKQGDVERIERDMTSFETHAGIVRWISLEPMLEPIRFNDLSWCDLVVIGAQTGTSQPDGWHPPFAPKFEWVADVVQQCRDAGIPYYLKPNLATQPGMQLTQMLPTRFGSGMGVQ